MKYKLTAEDMLETGMDDPTKCYYKEACYIAKKYSVHLSKVYISTDNACGEICIFVEGKWKGYIDFWFYQEMDGNPEPDWFYEEDGQ